MAKFIRFFLLVLALSFTTNNAFGIDYIVDFMTHGCPFNNTSASTTKAETYIADVDGITWNLTTRKYTYDANAHFFRIATANKGENDSKVTLILSGFSGTINKVEVNCNRTKSADTSTKQAPTLSVNDASNNYGEKNISFDTSTLEFPIDSHTTTITLSFNQPDKKHIYGLYIHSIKVSYTPAPDITLDEAEDNGTILKENLNKWANITLNRNFTNDGWYTLCLPFNLNSTKINSVFGDKTEVEEFAKVVTNNGVKELQFTTTDNIQAGVPYIIKPTKENIAKPTFTEVMISAASPSSVEHDGYQFVGTYSATEIEADDKYRLLGGNDGTVIANVSEAGTLKGTRCYFLFPSGSQPVNKSIGLGLPTAIHPNTYTVKQAKGVYTLQGIKINDATNLPSGIYVRNGKKFIIK